MMTFFFFFVCCCCFTCVTFVIGINNPIHSILLLLLVFFWGSILLLLLNVEFFAFIFLIVYVGAIAVLFLFMVMTLDIKIVNTSQTIKDFFSYKSLIIILLLFIVLFFIQEDQIEYFVWKQKCFFEKTLLNFSDISFLNVYFIDNVEYLYEDYSKFLKLETHLEILGKVLFTEHIFAFLFCSFILLIAMIGAIVLSIEETKFKIIKYQNPVLQSLRKNEFAIFNFKIYSKNIK